MIFCIDIDGTICSQEENYKDAKPFKNRIEKLNQYYDKGDTIIYFTARGTETGIDWKEVTEEQFKEWGVKYTKLIFGKPAADIYLDDKACEIENFNWSIK